MEWDWIKEGYFLKLWTDDAIQYISKEDVLPEGFAFFQVSWVESILNRVIVPTVSNTYLNFYQLTALAEPKEIEFKELKPHRSRIYQLGIGVKPDDVYIYAVIEGRTLWALDEVLRPSSADREIAYITQKESPFDNPQPESEVCLVYDTPLTLQAYNASAVTLTPKLKFVGRRAVIEHISPKKYPELHERLMKKMIPAKPIHCRHTPGVIAP